MNRYKPEHRDGCLQVFDSNVPQYFAPDERTKFVGFLNSLPGPFWIASSLESRDIVGCGGVSLADDARVAWLRWGMVHGSYHGHGIGTDFLDVRLAWISTQPTVREVRVVTAPMVSGFFRRFGFEVVAVTKNGLGFGIDRYDLVLSVNAGKPS